MKLEITKLIAAQLEAACRLCVYSERDDWCDHCRAPEERK